MKNKEEQEGEKVTLQTEDAVRLEPTGKSSRAGALDDTYDPHDHRNLPKPTNNVETLIHLLKCSLGTGILAMPQAFSNTGLITGVISTIVAGIILTHCLRILIRSQYAVCKRQRVPLLTYPAAVKGALQVGPPLMQRMARCAAGSVDAFLIIHQLGICCVYIIFIAESIKKVVDPVKEISLNMHMLYILLPLIAFNMIPNLKVLAPFSLLANILSAIALAIVVYYMLTLEEVSDDDMDMWGTFTTFPLFFGTVLFALTAVGVVVALENNMKTPKSFGSNCGVLNIGMTIIVALYVVVGALGYNFCVSECKDSITLNLPDTDLAKSVVIMYMIAIFISYGLHCYVPVEIVWRDYLRPFLERRSARHLRLYEYALRVVLCLLTFALALAVPRLGLFISLFGALCLSALGICFPAMMDLCCSWPNKRLVISKDIVLIIIGLVGLVAGTYTALHDIILSFVEEKDDEFK